MSLVQMLALASAAAAPPLYPARTKVASLPGVPNLAPYEYYTGYLDAGVPPSGRGKMYVSALACSIVAYSEPTRHWPHALQVLSLYMRDGA